MTMFHTETETLVANRVIRCRLTNLGTPLAVRDVMELWRTSLTFQDEFSAGLAAAPFSGFRWETPALTVATANRPFEYVLVNAAEFAQRKTDGVPFADHFRNAGDDQEVVSFVNLRKDATLVVPTPRTDEAAYGHLAAFVRRAPVTQVRSLWRELGTVLSRSISDAPVWVSTAGGGVAWLHVRLDQQPKYYAHAEYRRP